MCVCVYILCNMNSNKTTPTVIIPALVNWFPPRLWRGSETLKVRRCERSLDHVIKIPSRDTVA